MKDLSNPIVVFPRVDFDGNLAASRMFTQNEIDSVINGTAKIYAHAEIFYEDIFGEDRITRFAAIIEADSATLTKIVLNHPEPDLKIFFQSRSHRQFGYLRRDAVRQVVSLFDLLELDGEDLRRLPIEARKRRWPNWWADILRRGAVMRTTN